VEKMKEDIEFNLELFLGDKFLKKVENVKSSDVVRHIVNSEYNITDNLASQILKDRNRQTLNIIKTYFIPESAFKAKYFFKLCLTRTK
jgi:hypothetical protein